MTDFHCVSYLTGTQHNYVWFCFVLDISVNRQNILMFVFEM